MKFSPEAVRSLSKSVPFLVLGFAIVWTGRALGVHPNVSPSLPIGLYRDSEAGNIVSICPPEPWGTVSKLRGYRSASSVCPDDGQPILKPVVAREGDIVTVSRSGLSVNGALIQNSAPQPRDSTGRVMKTWPDGIYPVAKGTVWVVSTHHRLSFDSRYFGPVPVEMLRGRLIPLWTVDW